METVEVVHCYCSYSTLRALLEVLPKFWIRNSKFYVLTLFEEAFFLRDSKLSQTLGVLNSAFAGAKTKTSTNFSVDLRNCIMQSDIIAHSYYGTLTTEYRPGCSSVRMCL
jgi:hypothetical protein